MASLWLGKTVRLFMGKVAQRRRAGSFVTATVVLFCGALLATTMPVQAQNVQIPLKPEVEAFVEQMAREHGFEAMVLRKMFADLKPNQTIIKAFDAPATSRPWNYFRELYVTSSRIDGGVDFWNENAEVLQRAREVYGVPEEIITAIIGVETIYGQYTGKFQVADALYTLGFEVPRRSKFFQGQFEHFLLLARENDVDPAAVTGSFAGAMGIPQFMPSSYRQYAVDFDGDGRVDLWNSVADAIGSVANYLNRFGWEEGEQIVLPAIVTAGEPEALERLGVKPSLTFAEWRSRGVQADGQIREHVDAGFFSLEDEHGPQYWISLNNFYVITRYNRSKNYAMAVYQLSQEIAHKRREQQAAVARTGRD